MQRRAVPCGAVREGAAKLGVKRDVTLRYIYSIRVREVTEYVELRKFSFCCFANKVLIFKESTTCHQFKMCDKDCGDPAAKSRKISSALDQLKQYTTVVADTGDFEGTWMRRLLRFVGTYTIHSIRGGSKGGEQEGPCPPPVACPPVRGLVPHCSSPNELFCESNWASYVKI